MAINGLSSFDYRPSPAIPIFFPSANQARSSQSLECHVEAQSVSRNFLASFEIGSRALTSEAPPVRAVDGVSAGWLNHDYMIRGKLLKFTPSLFRSFISPCISLVPVSTLSLSHSSSLFHLLSFLSPSYPRFLGACLLVLILIMRAYI